MVPNSVLPPELRLNIYELRLAAYFDTPGVCIFPVLDPRSTRQKMTWTHLKTAPRIRTPVPAILQVELGEMRSRLLGWLAKEKGVWPVETSPVLRFPNRAYHPERDIIYLDNRNDVWQFLDLLGSEDLNTANSQTIEFVGKIRRLAIAASVRLTPSLPKLLRNLDQLSGLQELLVVFLIATGPGKLEYISSVPKDKAAYTIVPIRDNDLEAQPQALSVAIERLDESLRSMLKNDAKNLKITACKMTSRPEDAILFGRSSA